MKEREIQAAKQTETQTDRDTDRQSVRERQTGKETEPQRATAAKAERRLPSREEEANVEQVKHEWNPWR